ncbi:MAG: ATP synthase F1 subunit gamma, partial [Flavobacteriaceae bacterium]|nr:ATP synthase F1 subunit gamma [Flavobacteriaceae bacterium]
ATLDSDAGGAYSKQREVSKVLLVVVTSNRGLCGGFNSSVIKETVQNITANYQDIHVDLLTIGKKGNDILSKTYPVIDTRNNIYDELTFEKVAEVAEKIMHLYVGGTYDKIEIIYNRFKNAATQIPQVEQFLPIKPLEGDTNASADYIFEPSKEKIVLELIPKSLKTQLYKAVRDSFAAEHGARMTAMHKATDNATELRDELLLTYNKARQAAITNEILEIVGGAEALKN